MTAAAASQEGRAGGGSAATTHPPSFAVLARSGGLVLTYRCHDDDAEEFTVEREAPRPGTLAAALSRHRLALAAAFVAVVAAAAGGGGASSSPPPPSPPLFGRWAIAACALCAALYGASALMAVTSESLTVVRGVGVALETRRGRWAALLSATGGGGGGGGGAGGGGGGNGNGGNGGPATAATTTASTSSSGDAGVHREFLDVERVRSAVVNEHVTTKGVRFYMALVVYNRPDMAVAFPHLMPRLEILVPVYRRVHALLTGEGEGGGARPGGAAAAAAAGAAAAAAGAAAAKGSAAPSSAT